MSRRALVSAVLLIVGGGIGFAVCWYGRPAAVVPEPKPSGEEVVVEVRVKLPPGAIRPDDSRSASSYRQGALINTGEPFDLAVEGRGFFQLTLPNGETAYTRDGSFGTNPQGSIVTKQGYLLVPQVTIPQDTVNVAVGADGCVTSANPMGQVSTVGQITLTRFVNPGWLHRDENGLWVETAGSGPPHVGAPGSDTFGLVRQGFRERQAELDAPLLLDLVRKVVEEDRATRVRVER
jgi:flagellar basal-body rod protein FlgG